MYAELMTEAVILMRQRAEAALQPHHPYSDSTMDLVETTKQWSDEINGYVGGVMGEHAASWPPAVALRIVTWIENEIDRFVTKGRLSDDQLAIVCEDAIAVCREYLGVSISEGGSDA